MQNCEIVKGSVKALAGSPNWQAHFESVVNNTLEAIQDQGGDLVSARAAAVEALINAAASLHVHNIELFDEMGNDIPNAVECALQDFRTSAHIALYGEFVRYELTCPDV